MFSKRLPSMGLLNILVVLLPSGSLGGSHERRLLNDLMTNYQKLERPVADESQAVTLKFGLTLQQILDVEWTDSNMRWNKSEYNNVKDIRVPPSILWKPDILMYNSASEAFDATYPTNVVVTSEGTCTYIPPGIFMSSCPIDITWFPFDDQNCDMKFGSWTYNGFKLDFQLANEDGGDTASFIPNGEWALLGVPAQRNEVIYDCCPEPYLDITFTIKIRRRTLYYFFNLIVPCLLIASMAVLGFTLPPDSGEKLSLGVNLLLAIVLFSTIVGDMLPVTNNTPLIGTYFNAIMFMVASSVVTTIMVLNYHHRFAAVLLVNLYDFQPIRMVETHEMPDWVKTIFLQWAPFLLRMNRPGETITWQTIQVQKKMNELDKKETKAKSLINNILDVDDDFRMIKKRTHSVHPFSNVTVNPRSNSAQHHDNEFNQVSALQRELNLILKEIKIITEKLKDDEDSSQVAADWKFAAMVLDRLSLVFFSTFTLVATATVLAVAPHVIVK